MKKEQLIQANAIMNEIHDLKHQLSYWDEAIRFSNSDIVVGTKTRSNYVQTDLIDFDLLRVHTMDAIEEKIEKLEKEFEAL